MGLTNMDTTAKRVREAKEQLRKALAGNSLYGGLIAEFEAAVRADERTWSRN